MGGVVEPRLTIAPLRDTTAAADEDAIDVAEGFEGGEDVGDRPHQRRGADRGMREIGDERWAALLAKAQCQILSRTNEHIDAYVLSESSLFVFSHKVVLKTCGTTTLLRCVPMLLEFVRELGLEVEWFNSRGRISPIRTGSSRRTGFDAEVLLARHFAEGDAFVLGPLTADHWFVFDHDATKPGAMQRSMERTLDLMMFDIGEPLARAFYKEDRGTNMRAGKRRRWGRQCHEGGGGQGGHGPGAQHRHRKPLPRRQTRCHSVRSLWLLAERAAVRFVLHYPRHARTAVLLRELRDDEVVLDLIKNVLNIQAGGHDALCSDGPR